MRGGHILRADRTPVNPPATTTLVPLGWSDYPEVMMHRQAMYAVIDRYGSPISGNRTREVAAALRAAAAPRPENWTWPTRPAGTAPSGRAEPVRAAFCRFLETGDPYYTEET